MTISLEAAATLAQIIPVGLLIVGLEIKAVPKLVATGRAGTFLLWWLGSLSYLHYCSGSSRSTY